MSERDTGSVCPECAALIHDNARLYASLNSEMNARIDAEAQLSALRDQQPVAWLIHGDTTATMDRDEVGEWTLAGGLATPLVYAHPSCVTPNSVQLSSSLGDTLGDAPDQSNPLPNP